MLSRALRFIPQLRLPAVLGLASFSLAALPPLAAAETLPEPAPIATPSPWFADLSAGLSIIPAGDITLGGRKYEGDFKDGPFLRGAVGRRLGKGWAVEGEWFYRTNSVNSLVASDRRFTGGDAASNNLFLNATYSPGAQFSWRGISPYAGLGFGYIQELDVDLEGADGGEFSSSGSTAWQWSIGLRKVLGPRAELFLEGRAVAAGERELEARGGRKLKIAYDAWAMLAGLRWSF
jgi:hypothetical protein